MTSIVSFILLSLYASLSLALNYNNLDKTGLALKAYDPVSYFDSGKPEKGRKDINATHEGAIYYFTSEAHKSEFIKNPEKYIPQFGGWCAYAVADSKSKVDIDPQSFLIQDGRLLLFYNGFWGDTRKKWQNTKGKNPQEFLKEADQNWPEVKPKEP